MALGASNGTINEDDIFLLVQYTNGDVSARTYNVESDEFSVCSTPKSDFSADVLTKKTTVTDRTACTWGAGAATAPVNF